MHFLNLFIIVLYGIGLIAIFIYTLAQVQLVYYYLKSKKKPEPPTDSHRSKKESRYPMVTVQIPVYNERYVIKRLLDAVSHFDWPCEKFEIQVLDDSTDDTIDIIEKKLSKLQEAGFNIQHIRRGSREGYKAGALQYGLKRAAGEFIAIFDADFIPKADFLINTIFRFTDDNIGMAQTRWGHLNKNYSLLTRMQAFALDAHFSVEQKGRNEAGYFMNFNGTAGVWRKACIEDAGGWQHDTLTEDLDLSYRAQMKGWKFLYLEDVESPAELPVAISALKTQQYRWTKGAAETARKHLATVWKSEASFIKKVQGTSHLLSSSVFIFILLISVLSVPLLWIKNAEPAFAGLFMFASFFLLGLLGWVLFYGVSFRNREGGWLQKTFRFILSFPLFLSISMGFSLNNSMAVITGYAGQSSPFVRTPKFNITKLSDSWKENKYLIKNMETATALEGLLALYFLAGLVAAFIIGDYSLLPFHLMLFFGFGTVFAYSLYENMLKTA